METVTSFSASLLQGLGGDTALAAEIANKAITDMSDNANKMGTDMSSIQNAYMGFAKGNYTMLDNLKLGYGGTQSEMVRLINDSGILEKEIKDLDGITFDQMIEAIHEVQNNLGITGTTAKEASTTIQGSASAMKGAWQNLMTGIADENANFDQLINNLVESVGTFASNIIPRVQQALGGVGDLITALAPQIAAALPMLVETLVPALVESAVGIVQALVTALTSNAPMLAESAVEIMIALIVGLTQAIPNLLMVVPQIIVALVTALVEHAPEILDAGIQLLAALVNGFDAAWFYLDDAMNRAVGTIGNALQGVIDSAKEWGADMIQGLIDGIKSMLGSLADAARGVAESIASFLHFSEPDVGPLSNFHTYAPDMMKLFAQGIKDNTGVVTDAIEKSFNFGDMLTGGLTSGYTGATGVGAMSAASSQGGAVEIPITMEIDGTILAKKLYKHNLNEREYHGDALINAG